MRVSRLTTRLLMVIVAGAALLLAGPARLWHRSIRFEGLAIEHRKEIGKLHFSDLEVYLILTSIQSNTEGKETSAERRRSAEEWERSERIIRPVRLFYAFHNGQAEKYEAAAARPWSSVATDLPPPPVPPAAFLRAIRAWIDGDGRALAAFSS